MFERRLEGAPVTFVTPFRPGIAAQPEEDGVTPEENARKRPFLWPIRTLCHLPRQRHVSPDDARQPGLHVTAPQAGTKARQTAIFCAVKRSLPAICGSPGGKERALLRKAAETNVHAAGFGIKIGGIRPSDTSQVFSTVCGAACSQPLWRAADR